MTVNVTCILDNLAKGLENRNRAKDDRAALEFWVPELRDTAKWIEDLYGEEGKEWQHASHQ